MSASWATDPKVTIAERDEGQWFAYLGADMCGPYPDAEEARADLPVTNPARGAYCGDGLYGDHDEKHETFLAGHYLEQGKWHRKHDVHGGPHDTPPPSQGGGR